MPDEGEESEEDEETEEEDGVETRKEEFVFTFWTRPFDRRPPSPELGPFEFHIRAADESEAAERFEQFIETAARYRYYVWS